MTSPSADASVERVLLAIRLAHGDDVTFVRALSAEAFGSYGDYSGVLPAWLGDPAVQTLLAELPGEGAVGFAMLGPRRWRPITAVPCGELLALAVAPAQRQRGVGRRLLARDRAARACGADARAVAQHRDDEPAGATALRERRLHGARARSPSLPVRPRGPRDGETPLGSRPPCRTSTPTGSGSTSRSGAQARRSCSSWVSARRTRPGSRSATHWARRIVRSRSTIAAPAAVRLPARTVARRRHGRRCRRRVRCPRHRVRGRPRRLDGRDHRAGARDPASGARRPVDRRGVLRAPGSHPARIPCFIAAGRV